jgi:hypothetical protein
MIRILHWLTAKLSRLTAAGATEPPGFDEEEYGVSKEEMPLDSDEEEYGVIKEEMARGPAIYVEENGDTQPSLEIIKEPLRTPDMSEGFDPYNSGTFKSLKK